MTSSQQVDREKVILVEGKDEALLVDALLQDRFTNARSSVRVLDVGGKTLFRNRIQALRLRAERNGVQIRAFAIIRDAEENASNTWKSITNALVSSHFQPPSQHGAFSQARPSVGVFVLPDGTSPGALESLCRRSITGRPVARCVEQYLKCLDKQNAMLSKKRDKTFTHAFLASCKDPVARVGEAAQQGVWDFGQPAFAPLKSFINKLLQI